MKCSNGESSRVNALAWDTEAGVLFIGGNFDMVDSRKITSGIAIWTQQEGLQEFVGGSVSGIINSNFQSSEVKDLVYDSHSKV